jgi:hypothetical protein
MGFSKLTGAPSQQECEKFHAGLAWRSSLAPSVYHHDWERQHQVHRASTSAGTTSEALLGDGGGGRAAQGGAGGCTGSELTLAVCMLCMGVSAFPLTETLLLQSSLFSSCWGWGAGTIHNDYMFMPLLWAEVLGCGRLLCHAWSCYAAEACAWPHAGNFTALATLALFVPGLFVQLLQNRYDRAADIRMGSSAAAAMKLATGHTVQLLGLLVFFAALHSEGSAIMDPLKTGVLAGCFVIIGFGCSLVYRRAPCDTCHSSYGAITAAI